MRKPSSTMFRKLTISESMAALSVTDLRHVCEEINLQRRTLAVLEHQKKYSREYQAKYIQKKIQSHGNSNTDIQ